MAQIGQRIHVQGRVQGVGFRPYVWRLATQEGLAGQVCNDASGVCIDLWGPSARVQGFASALAQNPPPLAQIDAITCAPLGDPPPNASFDIVQSSGGAVRTQITPDAATCPDCLREVRNPVDRRHGYAFTNCTHCGPRLSIIAGIPYDRARTSMQAFAMCANCQREYDTPQDRRFHAQPNACPACGPRLWLEDAQGRKDDPDPVAQTARLLAQGKIVAIKGIGGFHLACDACNGETVRTLRTRKHRRIKPFALMARDIAQIRRFCHLSDAEAALLATPAAPIVLLQQRAGMALPAIAPGLDRIGVMLPHTPLHHLLLAQVDHPLVMTSGNASGVPQATKNAQARAGLAGIADAWLMHDRAILNRLDDSVMRVDAHGPAILRRGRGLAPAPVALHGAFADAPPVLAMGAAQKSVFCLLKTGSAVPSQHIGDLTTAETFADYRAEIVLLRDLLGVDPKVIAVDMHPDYLATRQGTQLAKETGAKLVQVQHHHAHLASTLAEHRIGPDDGPSVGVILDGTGLGDDGTVWGGEILVGDYHAATRKGHLQPVALPGGDAAAHAPWRNLVAHLHAAFGPDWRHQITGTPLACSLAPMPTHIIEQMIAQGVNAPLASSAGRLFDAVAASLGIAFEHQDNEGQAAMQLEAQANPMAATTGYSTAISDDGVLSWGPLWHELVADLKAGAPSAVIATRFHLGLGDGLAQVTQKVAAQAGATRIVLSGGVMQNRFLHGYLRETLTDAGFTVLSQQAVPANDGGIALGQAAIAAIASNTS